MIDGEEFPLDRGLLCKVQARWRGAVTRQRMRRVREQYLALFAELEQDPAAASRVAFPSDRLICKPVFRASSWRRPSKSSDVKGKNEEKLKIVETERIDRIGDVERIDDFEIKSDGIIQKVNGDDSKDAERVNKVCSEVKTKTLAEDVLGVERERSGNGTMSKGQDGVEPSSSWPLEVEREPAGLKKSDGDICGPGGVSPKLDVKDPVSFTVDGCSLAEQRHNLSLELLWVEQAIHSRKQYLRLKNSMAADKIAVT